MAFGTTVVGMPASETFTVKNTGSANLVLADPIGLPAGFTLVSDFAATTLAAGASTTFAVELSAAAAGDVSGSITFGTNLPSLPGTVASAPPGTVGATFSLPVEGEVVGLTNYGLFNDTGISPSDGNTSDPTVAGNLLGVPTGTTVEVQFQNNNDGKVDGSVQVTGGNVTGSGTGDSSGSGTGGSSGSLQTLFAYTPAGLAAGAVTVSARVHVVNAALGGDIYTAWAPLSFTLETGTDAAPVVANLALQTQTVANSSPPTSSEDAITGLVYNDGNVSYMTIQVDTTGSGTPDDSTTTDANGNFVYTPQNLTPGTYTYNFRAVENAYPSGQILGPWEPLTFKLVAPNAPVVDKLALADVTGPGTSTTDPTLSGHVTADGNPRTVEVDFSYTNNGVADASTTANADGTFTFKPLGLAPGNYTIGVRGVNVDQNLSGAWTTIAFTLAAPQAPTVSTLKLLNDTGSSGTDNVTDDPTVTGTLTGGVGVANVTVQFDTNGDGVPDGSTTSDANGNFTWTPTGLKPGTITISARAVTTDPNTGDTLVGGWTSLTFTYSTAAGPVVSALSLAHPTGTDPTTGDQTVIDATLDGSLTNGSALPSFLKVDYELGSDTTPDGSTTTDAQGNFAFTPSGLSPGTVTVTVWGVMSDPETGADVNGPTKSITFILEQNTLDQTPAPPVNTGETTSGDQVAATSQQASGQAIDAAISALNTAMGAGSTPSGEIALRIGTYTALSGMTGGRIVNGSIFGVLNGSVPAPVGIGTGSSTGGTGGTTGSGSTSGPSLPASTPLALPTTTPLTLASLGTPTAGSGTVTNQTISSDPALGPGSDAINGTWSGSWDVTVTPHGNVTDWTIVVELSETYGNSLSGSYTDTAGTASTTHKYSDNLGGSYTFDIQVTGTTTTTGNGTIVAGTYTLAEGDLYSYSFSDTPATTNNTTGASESGSNTVTAAGGENFRHDETGGSFSSGGGLPSSVSGAYSGPTVSSNFINDDLATFSSTDVGTSSYNNGSADGADSGTLVDGNSLAYSDNRYETGDYTNGGSLGIVDSFTNNLQESFSSTDTETDSYNAAAATGQINGTGNSTSSVSSQVTDSETGTWGLAAGAYTLDVPSFDYQESESETDSDSESGSMSSNQGGIAENENYSFNDSISESNTSQDSGSESATGTTFDASGSLSDSAQESDSGSLNDSGSYSGTVPAERGPSGGGSSGSGSSSASASPTTVNGSFKDSATETDSGTEGDSGSFSDNNTSETDQGSQSANAQSNETYSSSGSDNANDSSGDTASDTYSDSGSAKGTFSDSGSFSDGTTTSDSGSFSAGGTASDADGGTATAQSDNASGSTSASVSFSDNATGGFSDTGNYNDSGTSASMSDTVSGTVTTTATDQPSDTWSDSGSTSGSSSSTFTAGGSDSASVTFGASDSYTDTDSSISDTGTFTDNVSASSSDTYSDSGTSTDASSSTTYSDGGSDFDNSTDSGSGSFSDGTATTDGGTAGDSDKSGSDSSSTESGTYTDPSDSGSFQASASDDTSSSGSATDSYSDGASDSSTVGFSESTSDSNTFHVDDGGQFTGSQSGTYSDDTSTSAVQTSSETGTTNTGATGTSTAGTFGDTDTSLDTSRGSDSKQQGARHEDDALANYDSGSYQDSGTFTGSGGTESRTGTFNESDLVVSKQHEDDSGSFGGSAGASPSGTSGSGSYGTYTDSFDDTNLEKDAGNGSLNDVGTTDSRSGTATDDTIDALKTSSSLTSGTNSPSSTGTHSESHTANDTDKGHGSDNFSETGGKPTSDATQYTDDNRDNLTDSESDTSGGQAGAAVGQSTSDSSSDSINIHVSDGGTRSESGGTTTTTTDDGTATRREHDTGSGTDTINTTFTGGGSTATDGGGDTADYFTTGTYDITGTGETDSGTFNTEDRPSDTFSYQASYTAPGDPGTTWTASDNSTTNSDNADQGPLAQTNGAVTSETDNFNDQTTSTDTDKYNAASDQGGLGTAGSVAWVFQQQIPVWYNGPTPGTLSPAGFNWTSVTPSTSATASDTADDTKTDLADGTTTDTSGTTSTDETFNDTDKSDYSDNTWLSTTASYNNSGGSGGWVNVVSGSDGGSETDKSTGTLDAGVTTDNYL